MRRIKDLWDVVRYGLLKRRLNFPLKIRIFIAVAVLAWIVVGIRFASVHLFQNDMQITEAFAQTPWGDTESTLEYTAYYGSKYMTEGDKTNLLGTIAECISLEIDDKIKIQDSENRWEAEFTKVGKNSECTLKVITLEENKQYIYVSLTIFKDNDHNILYYKECLLDIFNQLETKDQYATIQIARVISGKINLEEKNKIAEELIGKFKGEIAYENREDELYSVYAYTGRIPEYIKIDETKINMQVAIKYVEEEDETIIYAATPLMKEDW